MNLANEVHRPIMNEDHYVRQEKQRENEQACQPVEPSSRQVNGFDQRRQNSKHADTIISAPRIRPAGVDPAMRCLLLWTHSSTKNVRFSPFVRLLASATRMFLFMTLMFATYVLSQRNMRCNPFGERAVCRSAWRLDLTNWNSASNKDFVALCRHVRVFICLCFVAA
ncbi:hypothetical protein BDW22DRAFT_567478 [Trametopsis cervina]|nr:hypothetical protein BDW22DRAFT_567478 [Trametopsis cervina]